MLATATAAHTERPTNQEAERGDAQTYLLVR